MTPPELDLPAALLRPPTAAELPSEDGEPMETPWHRDAMNLLIETVHYHWRARTDYFVGGNMFVYFSLKQVFNKDFRGPDFFVVKGVDRDRPRPSWVVWEEDGKYPDVIVELVSPSTAAVDRVVKRKLYAETFGTGEYFCYDPDGPRVEGWRLSGRAYEPIEPEAGRVWSKELELYLGTWDGAFQGRDGRWPRFFDVRGAVVPIGQEAEATKAEAERRRADAEKHRADAAETELARMRADLDALRRPTPPPAP